MMRNRSGFGSYQQFKREVLNNQVGSLSSTVEDIADEMFKPRYAEETDSMWDSIDSDDE